MNGAWIRSLAWMGVLMMGGCVDHLGTDMASSAATTFASVIGEALGQLLTGLLQ